MDIVRTIINCMYEYKYGTPTLSDIEYDNILNKLPIYHPLRNITWDIIDTLYPEYNPYPNLKVNNTRDYSIIDRFEHSKSILTINNNNASYLDEYINTLISYCYNNRLDFDGVFSLKMDGWNIKNYYKDNSLILSHTRNSTKDNMVDTTFILEQLTPIVKTKPNRIVTTSGEFVLKKTSLPYLRDKYCKRFANVRNSVSSFLHGNIEPIDFKYCDYFAFSLKQEEGEIFNNIVDTYTYLRYVGFKTPPYIQVKVPYQQEFLSFSNNCVAEFNRKLEIIEEYYKNKFSYLYECDGVVFQPNSKRVCDTFNSANHLSSGLIAIKLGYWGMKIYEARVINIYFTKSRVNRGLILEIEPTDTGFGTIRKVDIDNVARALENNIEVGDIIQFTVHSNQDIQFYRNTKEVIN